MSVVRFTSAFLLATVIFIVLSIFWGAVTEFIHATFGIPVLYLRLILTAVFIAELAYFLS